MLWPALRAKFVLLPLVGLLVMIAVVERCAQAALEARRAERRSWALLAVTPGNVRIYGHLLNDWKRLQETYQIMAWMTAGSVCLLLACGVCLGQALLRYRVGMRLQNSLCAACGYNLTGNVSGVCPECGAVGRPDLRQGRRAIPGSDS